VDERIGQLLDRQAITDQMYAYARWVDLNRPEEVAKLFIENCRLNFGPGDSGWFTGRDRLVDWLRAALAPYSATNHTISNVEITLDGTDRAQATSYVQAWHSFADGRPDLLAYGRYHDRWVRTVDGWLLEERRFKVAAGVGTFATPKEPIGRAPTPA
jgi:3-phenylpropionate/cinnamic acid dioxygenase small subunit